MIKEKATGEMYSSKKAMMKHEKMEGPKMRLAEKKGTKTLLKVKKKK
jgi:hypothetical protein